MATYIELDGLSRDETLRARVLVACTIAAEAMRITTPPAVVAGPVGDAAPSQAFLNYLDDLKKYNNRVAWAARTMKEPQIEVQRMLWAVLAQNKGLTVAQITGASDAAIQTAVNAALDLFALTA